MKISTGLITVLLMSGLLATQTVSADCRDDITPLTPTSRFTLNENGTVTDTQTGLMWMRCSLGQTWGSTTCTGDAFRYNWVQALNAPKNNNLAGFTDWYLPNIKELSSIVETSCFYSSINQTVFPGTPSDAYWSSSPAAFPHRAVWVVDFQYGFDGLHAGGNHLYVRLVRANAAQ
ncbi:Lcl C-terminal domain-containing protein [Pseudoalteromonas sp. NC201]|uniref:Lcl C-terminal domain-containing protein n=1 Tax=Pseudoalteromonas sp. NC201 TaxID=1514074 RepID=UPI000C7B83DB|nr:DUF1566 domain-containing protein [Pseudoalteromonas sp. NC201]AUJ71233.1 hypothetical protein PNC201_14965 [Pseudoalteromonas sp. NC201]